MSKINYDEKPKSRFTTTTGNHLARNAKAPVYLIDGILEQDAHGIVYGASMSFKSFAVLEMAHCIANGRPFMGHKVKQTGSVIYVCGEGAGGVGRRLKAQIITNGEFKNDFHLLNESIDIGNDDDMAELKLLISEIKPVLVIFDTFASLAHGINENDNGAVGAALNSIRDTCRTEFKTSSLVVHHTGKDDAKGSRGAYAFKANVDYEIELKRGNNDSTTTMHCEKMKDGENFKDIHMAAVVVDLDIPCDDKIITSLILKQIDAVKADKKKSLNDEERKVLNVLTNLVNGDDAMTPPKSVIDLFPDSPQNAPKKVTTVRTWFENSIEVITVSSEPEKEKEAKRSRFNRTRTKLQENGFIGVHGDVIWIANAPQPA